MRAHQQVAATCRSFRVGRLGARQADRPPIPPIVPTSRSAARRPPSSTCRARPRRDLDLYVYDEYNNLVCRTRDRQEAQCRWRPRWTGSFLVDVRNKHDREVEYVLTANDVDGRRASPYPRTRGGALAGGLACGARAGGLRRRGNPARSRRLYRGANLAARAAAADRHPGHHGLQTARHGARRGAGRVRYELVSNKFDEWRSTSIPATLMPMPNARGLRHHRHGRGPRLLQPPDRDARRSTASSAVPGGHAGRRLV